MSLDTKNKCNYNRFLRFYDRRKNIMHVFYEILYHYFILMSLDRLHYTFIYYIVDVRYD